MLLLVAASFNPSFKFFGTPFFFKMPFGVSGSFPPPSPFSASLTEGVFLRLNKSASRFAAEREQRGTGVSDGNGLLRDAVEVEGEREGEAKEDREEEEESEEERERREEVLGSSASDLAGPSS